MKRNTVNLYINTALLTLLGVLAATGLLMEFRLMRGRGQQEMLWGLGRHDWGELHLWLALSFLALAVLHLVLHWDWVAATMKELFRTARLSAFLISSIVLAALLLSAALFTTPLSIREGGGAPGRNSHKFGEHHQH